MLYIASIKGLQPKYAKRRTRELLKLVNLEKEADRKIRTFVYKRIGKDEEILVVLNPSGDEAVCHIPVQEAGEVIYENNGRASLKGGELRVPGASATFFSYRK
ncbi:MAG TPA: hypothetical protein IAB31_05030 [Candidatus Choladousia intestinavium]|uniref:Uncharacterized protein n=1 Tax=Candidatus Choladousia intestinavium TaxID=2840727 RepID=A0A9D1AB55_9FIRM|nr:hypothetical protein [Candidatus Choladousia intestinavium]